MTVTDYTDFYEPLCADIDPLWDITYADLDDNIPYNIDIENRVISVQSYGLSFHALMASPYFKPQAQLALVEGLRMARHMEWLDGDIQNYSPEDILLIGRACVADVTAHKINYAWMEKIENDNPNPWKHILCSDAVDVAQAYELMTERLQSQGFDDDAIIEKSMATAFNQWFTSQDRIRLCDHDTLNMMDDMIDDNTQFLSTPLHDNILSCITHQTGTTEPYVDHTFITDVMHNPYYRIMTDAVNQTHLNHIKRDINTFYAAGLTFQDATLAQRFVSH